MKFLTTILVVSLSFFAQANPAQAQWGDLKVKFMVAGEVVPGIHFDAPPVPGVVVPEPPRDRSLAISPKGELKNVVMWLRPTPGDKVPVHSMYDEPPELNLDITDCGYEPRITTIRVGQDLQVTNRDSIGHAIKFDVVAGAGVAALVPAKKSLPFKFGAAESLPMPVRDLFVPWMHGCIVIRDDPYMAVSGDDGTLTLKNVPAGEWQFVVWHERPGFVTRAKIGEKDVEWQKGRVAVKITDGETTDLGTVVIDENRLKKKG